MEWFKTLPVDETPEDARGEFDSIVDMLPQNSREELRKQPNLSELIEVVLDYGRLPMARFPSGDIPLSKNAITFDELEEAQTKIGVFGRNNRAGINKTLHRISCLRNKSGNVIGLTCRVGRDIPGSAKLIEDIIRKKKSVLLLGAPGVGKTTVIRSVCRILADEEKKRVMVVDTSNEIGGDGDIPHSAIGSARRFQVGYDVTQYDAMMEALENHMPEVIVIDEIGVIKECDAAETISKRGIQLIATAHGTKLSDLLEDPVLRHLMGNTQAVILSDDQAKRHKGAYTLAERAKKTIQERKSAPAFHVVVEMTERDDWNIHTDAVKAVDAILEGHTPTAERRVLKNGKVEKSSTGLKAYGFY